MATVKSNFWGKRIPAPVGGSSSSFAIKLTSVTPGATSDVLKVTPVPRGVTFTDALVQFSDGDTNATPTLVFSLQVTDDSTTKTLVHQSTIGQTGGIIRPTKVNATEDGIGFTTDNDNYYLRILYTTGAATAASSTVVVGVDLSGWYPDGALTE